MKGFSSLKIFIYFFNTSDSNLTQTQIFTLKLTPNLTLTQILTQIAIFTPKKNKQKIHG